MMNGYDMTGWGWFAMSMIVVGTIAVVGLIAWMSSNGARDDRAARGSARERLDARLADGEISTDEYRDRLTALHEA